jgi:DNA-binding response OmpR family regulator
MMRLPLRILIVDDDAGYCKQMADNLHSYGYEVRSVINAREVLAEVDEFRPNVILLDQLLGDWTGTDVLRLQLLRPQHGTPFIVVTGVSDFTDCIVSLEIGADDYVRNTALPRETPARVRAVLRRSEPAETEPSVRMQPKSWTPGNWSFSAQRRELLRPDGERCALTQAEFDTLAMLYQNIGQTVDSAALSKAVFGRPLSPEDRSVDTVFCKLQRKLAMPGQEACILTHRQRGSVFIGFPPPSA